MTGTQQETLGNSKSAPDFPMGECLEEHLFDYLAYQSTSSNSKKIRGECEARKTHFTNFYRGRDQKMIHEMLKFTFLSKIEVFHGLQIYPNEVLYDCLASLEAQYVSKLIISRSYRSPIATLQREEKPLNTILLPYIS